MAQVNARSHGFQELIWKLKAAVENNIEDMSGILQNSVIPTSEWSRYAFYDPSLKFSRNLVYEVQDMFRLVLICWRTLQGNQLHDHNQSDCYFKVLQGRIHEEQSINNGEIRTDNHYGRGQVCVLKQLAGSHRMENPDEFEMAVTLHLYIPPLDRYRVQRGSDGVGNIEELPLVSRYGYANDRDMILM